MPVANTCSTGYPHNGRANNIACWHDRRVDKRCYQHNYHADSLSLELEENVKTDNYEMRQETEYNFFSLTMSSSFTDENKSCHRAACSTASDLCQTYGQTPPANQTIMLIQLFALML